MLLKTVLFLRVEVHPSLQHEQRTTTINSNSSISSNTSRRFTFVVSASVSQSAEPFVHAAEHLQQTSGIYTNGHQPLRHFTRRPWATSGQVYESEERARERRKVREREREGKRLRSRLLRLGESRHRVCMAGSIGSRPVQYAESIENTISLDYFTHHSACN